MRSTPWLSFKEINDDIKQQADAFLHSWLPGGVVRGDLYCPLNPTRNDRSIGSFIINRKTGRWIDFATREHGGDFISLYAYIHKLGQYEAATQLKGFIS